MKKITIHLLLTIFLASCDFFNDTRICNETGKEITLKITFDSNVVKTWSGGAFADNIAKTFQNWDDNLIAIDVDTINYVSTYLIKNDSCGQIEGGNNRTPYFEFFKKLEVVSDFDTLVLETKEQMRNAFNADRQDPKYYFDLLIQKDGKSASR